MYISVATVLAIWTWEHWQIRKKMKALDKNVADLKEQFDNTQKSLADQQNIDIITMILENQREQFRLELEDVQTEMRDIKPKLQSLERKIAECEERLEIDKTEENLRKKQRLLNVQWKLERRNEGLEKLKLKTEKMLQSTGAEGREGN